MARKNKKRNSFPAAAAAPPLPSAKDKPSAKEKAAKPSGGQAMRETIESLVIAFVLAFLFRTFQAEAFVIPTGSMAPTLMGRHKDVACSECGQRFKVNASNEAATIADLERAYGRGRSAPALRAEAQCIGGVCPSCRYTMAFRPELDGSRANIRRLPGDADSQRSYNGDRILVNKYLYEFTDPQRWDVIVFKYPGDANTNYIKRLVGLPEEELTLRHGDVYVRSADAEGPPGIARKPPSKMLAMRQLVHDTDRDAAQLHEAGWPLRWADADADAPGWTVDKQVDGERLAQTYRTDSQEGGVAWLRYEHRPARWEDWRLAANGRELSARPPELVSDYNAYNSEIDFRQAKGSGAVMMSPLDRGLHWVGDLMVDADVEIESGEGVLLLDLVEAGQHFTCEFDLQSGEATLSIRRFDSQERVEGYSPKAPTRVRGAGGHRLRFANLDDQLTLWVDGSVVEFDAPTAYDAAAVFGGDDAPLPQANGSDRGDLAPVGVGARGAKVAVTRLQVWRDIYYIADSWRNPMRGVSDVPVTDYDLTAGKRVPTDSGSALPWEVCESQDNWKGLRSRREVTFSTAADQFFVMGDNSAASLDCRLWKGGNGPGSGEPGGPYLERKLLIGKAVCVYWPHSWLFPVPNLADMRLVR